MNPSPTLFQFTRGDAGMPEFRLVWCYRGLVPPGGSHPAPKMSAGRRGPAAPAGPRSAQSPPSYSLWRLDCGSAEVAVAGHAPVRAGAGDWLMPFPNVARSQAFAPGTEITSLCFSADWPDGRPLFPGTSPLLFPAGSEPELDRCARELTGWLTRQAGRPPRQDTLRTLPLPLRGHVELDRRFLRWIEAWADCLRRRGLQPAPPLASDARLRAVAAYLDGLKHVGRLPHAELRRLSGLSRPQLDRLFRRQFGITPREYLERRCLRAALGLLHGRDAGIKEVAAETGFSGPAHFCAWFHRRTGTTPSRLRAGAGFP